MRHVSLLFLVFVPIFGISQDINDWNRLNVENSPLKDSGILSVGASNNGDQVWFGTRNAIYLKQQSGWKTFSKYKDGFLPYPASHIRVDKNNTPWFVTGGGLFKFENLALMPPFSHKVAS